MRARWNSWFPWVVAAFLLTACASSLRAQVYSEPELEWEKDIEKRGPRPAKAEDAEAAAVLTLPPGPPGGMASEWDALFDSPGAGAPMTGLGTGPADMGEAAPPSWATTSADVLQLTADYVEFDRRAGRVVVKGAAYANLGEMDLWAQAMEVELGPGRIHATGAVRFRRPTEDLTGSSLEYGYKLREGEMAEVETWRGPNKIVAKRMEITPAKLVGHDLYTTACTHDPPHYRVSARRGTLVPQDRLVLENAAVRVGNKRLLGIGRYKIDLRQGKSSNFYLRPGYSTSRGFNVESGYDFYFSDDDFGRIILNSSTQAGGMGGAAFQYGYSKDVRGQLRAFRSVFRVRDANPGAGSVFLDSTTDSYSWDHQHKLSNRTRLSTRTNLTQQDLGSLGVNEELLFSGTLQQQVPGYDLSLTLNRRVDLDGDRYLQDNLIPILNQSPTLSFRKQEPIELGGDFRLALDGSMGVIEERLTGQTQSRRVVNQRLGLNLSGPGFEALGTRWSWNLQERLDFYSAAEDRQFTSATLNGLTPLGRQFELGSNLIYQQVEGATPFLNFDTLFDQTVANLFFRQRRGRRFNATWLQVSRDLEAGKFRSASSNFFWHSPEGARTEWSQGLNLAYGFTGAQDLGDMELRSVSTNTRFGRGLWRHQLITNYDWQRKQLASFSTGSDFRLSDQWRVQLASNWARDALGEMDRTRLAFALTRDLHAWEARLRWDVEQKEAFLEFYLKHAPAKRFALRTEDGDGGGFGLRPQLGQKLSRPGPIIPDIPRP